MMTIEPRAAQCFCCNARITLIVLLCVLIFFGAIGAIYWIPGSSDHAYQKYHTYLLCYRVWGLVGLALYILFLYGAVKRQSRILMAGFIFEIIGAVLTVILCLLIIVIPSVFTEPFVDLMNMSMSSAMGSAQGSSMSSQEKQQMQQMRAMMNTDSFAAIIVISMIIGLIIGLAIQSMICYLYLIVYREAKRFQDNQVTVCAVGVVMEQGNYPNCPSYPASNYPSCEKKTPMA
ncbi:hypothetical protein WR25_09765 [Diploscapter pachys]|uniref:Uncharacterized protein n=1 Tax=Diploscapter pachys TaxID=2018661 RepID=A0A2A2K348_9BILA|nr:hypothetical protein WR25_09765 [Diploscapter pachys]